MASVAGVRTKITGVTELVRDFDVLPEDVKAGAVDAVTGLTDRLYGRVVRKASGSIIALRTGKFVRSLRQRIFVRKYGVRGTVRSTLGRRAGFINFGGHAAPRDIAPVKAVALHFVKSGKDIFAGIVHHPGPRIKPHEIFISSLEEMRPEIDRDLAAAVSVSPGSRK